MNTPCIARRDEILICYNTRRCLGDCYTNPFREGNKSPAQNLNMKTHNKKQEQAKSLRKIYLRFVASVDHLQNER